MVVSSDGRNISAILEVVLSSSRRVKKGPGRRPQSAKRRRFMELRERGLGVRGRCAGGRRVAGRRGTTGPAVTRLTATAGRRVRAGAGPAEPCVRSAPGSFAGRADRDRRSPPAGLSVRQIALGWAGHRRRSRVSCAATPPGAGLPPVRGAPPGDRAARPRHRRRIEINVELRQLIAELLAQRWSPQQISRQLRRRFPDDPAMWLCHESIYQAVYQPGSLLLRPSPLAPQRRSPLRTGRDHRRAHQRIDRRRPRFEQPMLHDPPAAVPARGPLPSRALGRRSDHRQGPAFGNRHAGRAPDPARSPVAPAAPRRRHPARRAEARLGDLPRAAAVDHLGPGTEMARHLTITKSLGAPVYWQARSAWPGSSPPHVMSG